MAPSEPVHVDGAPFDASNGMRSACPVVANGLLGPSSVVDTPQLAASAGGSLSPASGPRTLTSEAMHVNRGQGYASSELYGAGDTTASVLDVLRGDGFGALEASILLKRYVAALPQPLIARAASTNCM